LIAAFWLWLAYLAWKKRATWDRWKMKWVPSRRRSKEYFFDVGFFLLMGIMILSVSTFMVIKG
jgi:hypothetical protein